MRTRQFTPLSQTHVVAAAVSAPAGVQIPIVSAKESENGGIFRIVNNGTVDVWLGVGGTATTAQTNAAIASSGSPANGVFLLAGAAEVFRFAKDSFFSAITASGTSNVVISQGNGE